MTKDEKIKEQKKKYRETHKEQIKQYRKEYYKKNKEKVRKEYYNRYHTDEEFRQQVLSYQKSWLDKDNNRQNLYKKNRQCAKIRGKKYMSDYMKQYRKTHDEYNNKEKDNAIIRDVKRRYNADVSTIEEALFVREYHKNIRLTERIEQLKQEINRQKELKEKYYQKYKELKQR